MDPDRGRAPRLGRPRARVAAQVLPGRLPAGEERSSAGTARRKRPRRRAALLSAPRPSRPSGTTPDAQGAFRHLRTWHAPAWLRPLAAKGYSSPRGALLHAWGWSRPCLDTAWGGGGGHAAGGGHCRVGGDTAGWGDTAGDGHCRRWGDAAGRGSGERLRRVRETPPGVPGLARGGREGVQLPPSPKAPHLIALVREGGTRPSPRSAPGPGSSGQCWTSHLGSHAPPPSWSQLPTTVT